MNELSIYEDIAKRSGGDIYIGVVGPVRSGKSTFIKRFMEEMVPPNIADGYEKEKAKDELPQSAKGAMIMTTEPKFIPQNAVEIKLKGNTKMNVKMIDCVGYLVDGAIGSLDDEGKARMVHSPWSDEEIPFKESAELGTKKVITDHSTIGVISDCQVKCNTFIKNSFGDRKSRHFLGLLLIRDMTAFSCS